MARTSHVPVSSSSAPKYSVGCSALTPSIQARHCGCVAGSSSGARARRVSATSPCTGAWVWKFLPISAGSMSIWTIFAPGIEVLEAPHRAVVEAHPDADHDVGGVGGHVAVVVAVHAQEAVREGVRVGDRGDAQQRRDDGGVDLLGDRAQLIGRAGEDDALPGQDDGLLGGVDEFGGAFDIGLGGARDDRIAAQMHALRVAIPVGRLDEHVLGDVDEHRPLAARGGDVEGLLDGLRHLAGAHHEVVVLRDRQRDAGDVGLLEAVAAEQVTGRRCPSARPSARSPCRPCRCR